MRKSKRKGHGLRRMRIDGLPVVDATKRLQITISKGDIKGAKSKDPSSCAAARACVRQVSGVTEARVHLGRVYLKTKKAWVRFKTPLSIRSEIISFDRRGGFAAGDYTLPVLSPIHNVTSAQGRGRPKGSRNRAPLHVVHGVRAHGLTEANWK